MAMINKTVKTHTMDRGQAYFGIQWNENLTITANTFSMKNDICVSALRIYAEGLSERDDCGRSFQAETDWKIYYPYYALKFV